MNLLGKMLEKGKMKGRRSWRKLTALGLAASLAAGILGGCGAGGEGTGNPSQTASSGGKEGSGPAGEDGQSVARGRYVETEMPLPQEAENDRFVSLFWGEDHRLELYTAMANEEGNTTVVRRYLWEGEDWQADPDWWDRVRPLDQPMHILRVFYGLDENYYFSGIGEEEYIYHLFRVGEDGNAVELLSELFLPADGQDYGMIPTKAEAGKDGNIMLHRYDDVVYYQTDGKKLFSLEKSWSGTSESSVGYLTENEFVTKTDGGVTRYSLMDGQVIEVLPYDWGNSEMVDESVVLFGDGDGGIYVANEKGLAHVGPEGTLWELVIDGSLNTMGMRSMYLNEFLEGEDNDYYGAYKGDAKILLCHYTYDPDVASAPPVALTVYGLEDNSTIRQAAALFQKSHPDVRVEVLTGANSEGDVSEETIRVLNTELLSGKGADVLVLDGLPAKSYEEKGILMDLREVFAAIGQEDPLMEQVVKNFTGEDGSIYQMPARIQVPVAIGEPSTIRAFDSLDSMAAYEGERPLLPPDIYENLLRLVANLQYTELFGQGYEGLTEDMLVKYLETVKAIGDENGSRTLFTQEEMERLSVSSHVMPDGFRADSVRFDQDICACGLESLSGMFEVIIPLAVLERHPEAAMATVNGIYLPNVRVGVNGGTIQPELAKEFVRCLFSSEVQKEEFYDGFPVSLKAQQENCEQTGKDNYAVGSGYGDYYIGGKWPEREKREEIYQMFKDLSVPAMVEETVMDMIVAGSRDYFEGKATARQAAEAIRRQIALYEAEQG